MDANSKKSAISKHQESKQISKGIVPNTFSELIQISKLIKSAPKFLPKGKVGYSVEELAVNIQQGLEIGLTVMQAIQGIMIVNGAASVWGDYMIGLVLASGKLRSIDEGTNGKFPDDEYVSYCVVQRKGLDRPIRRSFSIADAKRAGLWTKSEIWKRYPKRMLSMRARSWALRDMFGDVLKGLVAVEETVDYSKKDEQVIMEEIESTGYQEPLATDNEGTSCHSDGCSGDCSKQEPSSFLKKVSNLPDIEAAATYRDEVIDHLKHKLMEICKDKKEIGSLANMLGIKSQTTIYVDTLSELTINYDSFVGAYCKRSDNLDEETIHHRASSNFKTFWKTFYGWLIEKHSDSILEGPMLKGGE